jgi:hypothetical protein
MKEFCHEFCKEFSGFLSVIAAICWAGIAYAIFCR